MKEQQPEQPGRDARDDDQPRQALGRRLDPALAQRDQIIAIPTLIRQLPEPLKRIIGDLSNAEKVLVGLDIQPN